MSIFSGRFASTPNVVSFVCYQMNELHVIVLYVCICIYMYTYMYPDKSVSELLTGKGPVV